MTLSARARKDKGNRAEREVVQLIRDHTGIETRRTLAGHPDDQGDLHGLPCTTVQVKSYADVGRAMREGLDCLRDQQASTGDPFGVTFVRRPGGRYVCCMEPEQFFALWREAQASHTPTRMPYDA